MNNISINSWKLNDTEIGYFVGNNTKTSENSFRVFIPKILPMIDRGPATVRTTTLNSSCTINSMQCKIPLSSSIKTQNYIEIKRENGTEFARPILKNNAKVKIHFENGNIDSGVITSRLDPSEYDKNVKITGKGGRRK